MGYITPREKSFSPQILMPRIWSFGPSSFSIYSIACCWRKTWPVVYPLQICICVPSCESLVLPLRICLYKTQHASAWMVHSHLSAGSLGSVSHLLFCVCILARSTCVCVLCHVRFSFHQFFVSELYSKLSCMCGFLTNVSCV